VKYLGNNSFVLEIEIHKDRLCCTLKLSRKAYIDKVLDLTCEIVNSGKFQSLEVLRKKIQQGSMS